MTVLTLGAIGWIAGLVAYVVALGVFYQQWISRGDFTSVAFTSLVVFAVSYWLLYLPVLRAMRRWIPRPQPAWVFPFAAVSIGVAPTAVIARVWSGSFRALLTPEALLFFVLFVVVGLVIGFGFTRLREPPFE